jgi:hypothetical protein
LASDKIGVALEHAFMEVLQFDNQEVINFFELDHQEEKIVSILLSKDGV